jgi:hypothetical protein
MRMVRAHLKSGGLLLTLKHGTAGVKIRQIAPNAISGSYTFDMHQPCRTAVPASPHPKGMAAEAGRPRPISDPDTSVSKTLHRKSRISAASQPAVSSPFNFGILKGTTPLVFTPPKEGPAVVDALELKSERRRSFGATFSFLQPRRGRNRLGSRSSRSSTKSGASTSGSEDGEPGSGSESVSAVPKQKQAQPQTSNTHHSASSISRLESPLASNKPALPQPSYHKAQTKRVLNHARAELMKEVRKAGYNVLVVEG